MLAHGRQRGPHAMVRSHEVNVHDVLHLAACKCVDRAPGANARARHYQVDTPKGIDCLTHKSLYLLLIGDICRHAQYLTGCFSVVLTYLFLCLLQSQVIDVRQDNMCAPGM